MSPRPTMPIFKTSVPEIVWPSVPSKTAAALLAQLFQLEQRRRLVLIVYQYLNTAIVVIVSEGGSSRRMFLADRRSG